MSGIEKHSLGMHFDLHKLVYLIDSVAGQKLTEYGSPITYSQYLVLSNIGTHGKINQRTISKIISVSDAAISRQVDFLRKGGFLVSVTNTSNRRERILSLTMKGEIAVNKALEVIESIFNQSTYCMEDYEITKFNQTIDKLIGLFLPMRQG